MSSRFAAGEACSQMSRALCEPLAGTAPHVDLWLLLEYGLPWTAKISEENALPAVVTAWLAERFDTLPRTRLQFIKQGRKRSAPYRLYIVVAHPERPRMAAFTLNRYEEILDIDLEAIQSDAPQMRPFLTPAPLYLVCTNSRRDPCCAKHGFPLYKAMAAKEPKTVWQTTHVGGDRFAANVLCFPYGLCFGRVDEAGGAQLLQQIPEGTMPFLSLRGRSGYKPIVQAAERMLREQLGLSEIDALTLIGAEHAAEQNEAEQKSGAKEQPEGRREAGTAAVTFLVGPNGVSHTLHLIQEEMMQEERPALSYKNCRAKEMTSPSRFRLL